MPPGLQKSTGPFGARSCIRPTAGRIWRSHSPKTSCGWVVSTTTLASPAVACCPRASGPAGQASPWSSRCVASRARLPPEPTRPDRSSRPRPATGRPGPAASHAPQDAVRTATNPGGVTAFTSGRGSDGRPWPASSGSTGLEPADHPRSAGLTDSRACPSGSCGCREDTRDSGRDTGLRDDRCPVRSVPEPMDSARVLRPRRCRGPHVRRDPAARHAADHVAREPTRSRQVY